MRQITLTQGKIALVDDDDFERLNQWKWYAIRCKTKCRDIWYAVRGLKVDGKLRRIYMHREIAAVAEIPEVDHQDGNGLHNCRQNLRPATLAQNRHNQHKRLGCTSRFKGVSFNKNAGKWEAQIKNSGRRIYLGYFGDETMAARTYDEAARLHFGIFAKTNFPATLLTIGSADR